MFTKTSREKTGLEKAIDDLLNEMNSVNGDSEEYTKMTKNLSKLMKMREHDARPRVSPDTIAVVSANLLGIAMIVGHERAHVVASKALNFVQKVK